MFLPFLTLFVSIATQLSAVFYVNTPSIYLYEKPENGAIIEDSVCYATPVNVIQQRGEWVEIEVPLHSSRGWTILYQLAELESDPIKDFNAFAGQRGAYIYNVADTIYGVRAEFPSGTPIQIIEEPTEQDNRWMVIKLLDGSTAYIQRGQIVYSLKDKTLEEMLEYSQKLIGLNYLFGGTSSLGYDCSGFVQMLYARLGVNLPRNSRDQAEDPHFATIDPKEAAAGDLIFFVQKKNKVGHVGLMLSEKEFIHSFPRDESAVKISDINEERWTDGSYSTSIIVRRLTSPIK